MRLKQNSIVAMKGAPRYLGNSLTRELGSSAAGTRMTSKRNKWLARGERRSALPVERA